MKKSITLQKFSFRFAEQVLNSKLSLKQEIDEILTDPITDIKLLTKPYFNELLKQRFVAKGWKSQPYVLPDESRAPNDPAARMDFLKDRVGIEVGFGHNAFLGIDLLKFQVASYSGFDKIDVGVYVVTTNSFQKTMKKDYGQKRWEGSLSFEKVIRYIPHFKSAIQLPIFVIGIDL
jgi:hypothetical protein